MSKNYSIENLEEIAAGDADFVVIIAKTFLEEISPDLKALEEAIANDNKELAYQFAHKMKPNLEMFGINVLKDITSIESWTRTSKSRTTVASNVENVSAIVNEVFEELKSDFNL